MKFPGKINRLTKRSLSYYLNSAFLRMKAKPLTVPTVGSVRSDLPVVTKAWSVSKLLILGSHYFLNLKGCPPWKTFSFDLQVSPSESLYNKQWVLPDSLAQMFPCPRGWSMIPVPLDRVSIKPWSCDTIRDKKILETWDIWEKLFWKTYLMFTNTQFSSTCR